MSKLLSTGGTRMHQRKGIRGIIAKSVIALMSVSLVLTPLQPAAIHANGGQSIVNGAGVIDLNELGLRINALKGKLPEAILDGLSDEFELAETLSDEEARHQLVYVYGLLLSEVAKGLVTQYVDLEDVLDQLVVRVTEFEEWGTSLSDSSDDLDDLVETIKPDASAPATPEIVDEWLGQLTAWENELNHREVQRKLWKSIIDFAGRQPSLEDMEQDEESNYNSYISMEVDLEDMAGSEDLLERLDSLRDKFGDMKEIDTTFQDADALIVYFEAISKFNIEITEAIISVLGFMFESMSGSPGGGPGGGGEELEDLLDEIERLTLEVERLEQEASEFAGLTQSLNDAKNLIAVVEALTLDTEVAGNMTLPTIGQHDVFIGWESSNPGIIAFNGTVNRPTYTTGDVNVTLTATLTIGDDWEMTKTFTVKVLKAEPNASESVALDTAELTLGFEAGDSLLGVTRSLTLPLTGSNGTTISWLSNTPGVIANGGTVNRPSFEEGNQSVTLTATIAKQGTANRNKTFHVIVLKDDLEWGDIEASLNDLEERTVLIQDKEDLTILIAEVRAEVQRLQTASGNLNDAAAIAEHQEALARLNAKWNQAIITGYGLIIADLKEKLSDPDTNIEALQEQIRQLSSELEALTAKESELEEEVAELEQALGAANQFIDAVNALAPGLQVGDTTEGVTGNLTLPLQGAGDTVIAWTSSNEAVVVNDAIGTVSRPSYGDGDVYVVLTATVTLDNWQTTKSFVVKVLKALPNNGQSVSLDKAALMLNFAAGDSVFGITQSLTLPQAGSNGTTINWQSSDPSVISTLGVVTRPNHDRENKQVTLTATIAKGGSSDTKVFVVQVLKAVQTDNDAVENARQVLMPVFSGVDSISSVKQSLQLPVNGADGTAISWSSSDPAVISATGAVTRPAAGQPKKTVDLTATITKGGATTTKVFTISVIAYETGKAYVIETSGSGLGLTTHASGITATVRVQARDTAERHERAVVVFQLMRGNEAISIVAFEKEQLTNEKASAHFYKLNGNAGEYHVNVFVYDNLSTALDSVQSSLANPVKLQAVNL